MKKGFFFVLMLLFFLFFINIAASTCGRIADDIYTKGFCAESPGDIYWDECAGKDYVVEYFCSAQSTCVATFSTDCNMGPNGPGYVCVDGACVPKTCSIGGNPFKQTCTDNFGSHEQVCSSSTAVVSWSCSNNECIPTTTSCLTGTGNPDTDEVCVGGLCTKGNAVCSVSDDTRCVNVGNDIYVQECDKSTCDGVSNYCLGNLVEKCEYGCEDGECKPQPVTQVCTPEEKRCTGDTLEICELDGSAWEEEKDCEYGCENKKCNPEPVEETCTTGEKRCHSSSLQMCKSDGSAWETTEVCIHGCNSTTFSCNSAPFSPPPTSDSNCTAGEKRCMNNILETCNLDGSAWGMEECTYECNLTTLSCNPAPSLPSATICIEGEKQCYENNLQVCSDDGFNWKTQICEYGCDSAELKCKQELACTELWECSNWTACVEGEQLRVCIDKNSCGTTINKPTEEQGCGIQNEDQFVLVLTGIIIILLVCGITILFSKLKK